MSIASIGNRDIDMSQAEIEELQFAYLDYTKNYYRKSLCKGHLPISARTLWALRKDLFKKILASEVCEEHADVAQRVLSTQAKALERKKITAEGRAIIEAEEIQEKVLKRQGFSFWPGFGDYIKAMDSQHKYRLHIFLSEGERPTATLVCGGAREVGRWTFSNLKEEVAGVVAEAKQRVVSLRAKA